MKNLIFYIALVVFPSTFFAQAVDTTPHSVKPRITNRGMIFFERYYMDNKFTPEHIVETHLAKYNSAYLAEMRKADRIRTAGSMLLAGVCGFYLYDTFYADYRFNDKWTARDITYLAVPALTLGGSIYLGARATRMKNRVLADYNR